VNHSKTA
jgi:hypothetical protein